LVRSANRRLERARRSRGEGGPPDRIQATAGWQTSLRFCCCVLRLHFAIEIRAEPAIHASDARSREDHQDGRSPHTAKFAPWLMVAYFAFVAENTAVAFERYLKSGSGRAFATRHLWPNKVNDS